MTARAQQALALHGGAPVRRGPFPLRRLFGEEERRVLNDLLDEAQRSGHKALGYGGPQEEAYGREFSAFLGGGYADGVNSGTNAVYVALRALALEPFSEVIVPAVSDPGGVMPVALCNHIPVPADGHPGCFNIGAAEIEARLTERTRAVIVAHIAGLPADMDPIMELARARGLKVIEDCAQAHGARYRDRMVGTLGDVAAFSTMFGKHHATGGQGGVVFTRDEALAAAIRRCADRGKPIGLQHTGGNVVASLNCNMDELHAALGRVQLQKLPGILRRRRAIAERLERACRDELQTVRLVVGRPEDDPAPWFLFFDLERERLTVGKEDFFKALSAELPGFPLDVSYLVMPVTMPWFRPEALAALGLPRDRLHAADDPRLALPNIRATDARRFRTLLHEDWTEQEEQDLVAALKKVEQAYRA